MKLKYTLTLISFFIIAFAYADFDVLITHGRIIDGSGNPAYFADIGIKDGKIQAIGHLEGIIASDTINASGLDIAPGFIDVHTHVDNGIFRLPKAENFIRDGVTTVVTGNCGSSEYPIGEYLKQITEKKSAINIATLVGHGTIRRKIMGSDKRDPTPEEYEKMKNLVANAMEDGAVGLSSGLIYIPGTFCKTTELVELGKVVSKYHGIYATHMRNEGNSVLKAISEACYIGWAAKVPVQVSHLKIGVPNDVGPADLLLQEIKQWRADGLDVTSDQYPYPASSTGLSVLLPDWVLDGGMSKARERMKDPKLRKKIREEMIASYKKRGRKDLSYAVIASYRTDTTLQGTDLMAIAKIKHGSTSWNNQVDTVMDLLLAGDAGMVYHGMDEKDVRKIMQADFIAICSDAGAREPGAGVPHPRGYGSNARVLGEYVRNLHILTWEDAVRKMTSLPAQIFHFKNRGLLREGFQADITIFDPKTVSDKATFINPHQFSTGIPYVLVNGKIVVRNNENTDALPGMPIYGPGTKAN